VQAVGRCARAAIQARVRLINRSCCVARCDDVWAEDAAIERDVAC
jgi:hypothetical protein